MSSNIQTFTPGTKVRVIGGESGVVSSYRNGIVRVEFQGDHPLEIKFGDYTPDQLDVFYEAPVQRTPYEAAINKAIERLHARYPIPIRPPTRSEVVRLIKESVCDGYDAGVRKCQEDQLANEGFHAATRKAALVKARQDGFDEGLNQGKAQSDQSSEDKGYAKGLAEGRRNAEAALRCQAETHAAILKAARDRDFGYGFAAGMRAATQEEANRQIAEMERKNREVIDELKRKAGWVSSFPGATGKTSLFPDGFLGY